ncbi:OmpA family protein [Streptomyces sediminimaris]|uniref:OmpA family protein n=1 Tax=Streptomyces sediminimaris TaxID=3383721 RepID=UPI00399BFAE0
MSATRGGRPARHGRTAAALVVGTLLAGLVVGCGSDGSKDGCVWMKKASPADGAGSTVVLVDGSASVRGSKSGADAPDYRRAVHELLSERVEKGDTFFIGTFGGASDAIPWTLDGRSADWKASAHNKHNQQANRDRAVECLADDVTTAQRRGPADGGTDLLAALATATAEFRGDEGERRVVVLSDGLSNAGCSDLRSAQFGSEQEIASIVSVCAAQGAYQKLPDLHGVEVTFLGLGRSAGTQPSANRSQRAWLSDLWKEMCVRAGGTAQTCTASSTPVGAAPLAVSGRPNRDDPVVPYGDGLSRTYSLSGAALFRPDSARVLPTATPTLTDLAVRARTTPGLDRVVVDGYVDPRGPRGNDRSLSRARADAVARVLVAHGVPGSRVEAHGLGVSPGCPAGTSAEHLSRAELLRCDRRVDIRILRT